MLKSPFVLTVNSSFPEMEHLASGFAAEGLLSCHVRPYANKGRRWERSLENFPLLGNAYRKTLKRRTYVIRQTGACIREHAIILDLCMALTIRIPIENRFVRSLNAALLDARTRSIARAGAKALFNENAIVASMGVAELAFKKIKKCDGLCVLNYSIAHHAFVEKFLLDEAEREPAFADTLKSSNWPKWLTDRMDNEIDFADKILVGSSFVRDSFLSEHVAKEKLVVLPYGVDAHFFTPLVSSSIESKKFRVLFVGQISQRKGISYLLRAFKRYRSSNSSLTLVGRIQGDGKYLAPWKDTFRHISHCPQIELRKIYQNNDVFLFPTLIEGMPLVVLEAMACGLPVITTANGPSDIVRDGKEGFIVPSRNIDAIVDCLERLRKDKELRIWMGKNARERALSFSWEVYRSKAVSHVQEWFKDTRN